MYVRQLPAKKGDPEDSGLWRVEYRDARGRRHGASFVLEDDARAWGVLREAEVRMGVHRDPTAGRILVRDWEKRWWSARVVAETTRAANRSRLDNYVLPEWGDVMLDEIETMDVQAWVKRLMASGLANDTVRNCHGLLSNMLDWAVVEKRLQSNPAKGATRTKPGVQLPAKGIGREVYYTEDQVLAAVEWFDEQGRDQDGTIVMALAYLGLRWGECAGLKASRVAMLRRQVEVRDVIEQVKREGDQMETRVLREYPKGKKRRHLPIGIELSERLAKHMERHPPERQDSLLFRRLDDTAAGRGYGERPEALSRQWARTWKKAVRALKLPDGTPHDLRHTYASWLVQDGVSIRKVQLLMGHESVTTTERYSHLAPNSDDEVLRALDGRSRASRRASGPPGIRPTGADS